MTIAIAQDISVSEPKPEQRPADLLASFPKAALLLFKQPLSAGYLVLIYNLPH